MSFKREGDDKSQLNVLQKRRVAELLSNYIPDDEASILSNGRFTCLVCSYRPVLDTVDMLTVHRNGKRHLEGLKRFYSKKASIRNEIAKRRQEKYLESEQVSQEVSGSPPLLAETQIRTRHALLKSSPYNSCHRKTSTKTEKLPPSCRPVSSLSLRPEERPPSTAGSRTSNTSNTSSTSNTSTAAGCSKEFHVEESSPMSDQKKKELEIYLKLKSSGWIQDSSGQWLKDENVEFDSDEEEPPSLIKL